MMTLITGNSLRRKAFTLIEVLAVLALIAVIMGAVVFGFTGFGSGLRSEGGALVKDLQGAYYTSIRKGHILRLSFAEDKDGDFYVIEKFELPAPPPSPDDEEAFKAWEEAQEEKDKNLRKLSREELAARTLLDEGEFKLVKKKRLGSLKLHQFFKANAEEGAIKAVVFYPTGEVDDALIVLTNDSNDYFSIVTDPMTGQIKSFANLVTEEEWKKQSLDD